MPSSDESLGECSDADDDDWTLHSVSFADDHGFCLSTSLLTLTCPIAQVFVDLDVTRHLLFYFLCSF